MKLKVKVVGAPQVEVRVGNKEVPYNYENAGLFDELRENYDLLEFVGNIEFPTAEMESLITNKLNIRSGDIQIVDVTWNVKGDSNEFLLYGEIEFEATHVRLGKHVIDVSEDLYPIFDDVFNANDCFYDKSKLERRFEGWDFYIYWNDDVVQCFGAILEFGGIGDEI